MSEELNYPNRDQPAFPTSEANAHTYETGLTKREYFAAMAMQGIIATITIGRGEPEFVSLIVESAVKHADALIEELEKPK